MNYDDLVVVGNSALLVFKTDQSITNYGFHIGIRAGKMVLFNI